MRHVGYILCLCLIWQLASGQSLLWQQRWPGTGPDYLTDVVSLEDGTFLTTGLRSDRQGVALLRFSAWGDTLYSRILDTNITYYQTQKMVRLSTGQVYLMALRYQGLGRLMLYRIKPETGELLWQTVLPGVGLRASGAGPRKLIEGPNHTLVLAARCDLPTGQSGNAGYLACYDTLGTLQWDTIIREHPTNTFCHHVEMTRDGNILVSGTAGSRIFAAEYAQDGFEIRRATFYQSQGRINFDYNPTVSVRQAPGDRYVVSGQILTNPTTYYIGLHQGWAGAKVWGGESNRVALWPVQVNTDGSVSCFGGSGGQPWMARLRSDSSILWRTPPLLVPGGSGATMLFSASASLPDSSSICVGYAEFLDSTQQDWYAARITGMGIPYRPWQPATATQAKASQPAPRPYPSPCSSTLHFAGLAAPASLELYGTDGRLHLSQAVALGQAVDVSALVAGVYGYQLTAQGKVWRGRVVKR